MDKHTNKIINPAIFKIKRNLREIEKRSDRTDIKFLVKYIEKDINQVRNKSISKK